MQKEIILEGGKIFTFNSCSFIEAMQLKNIIAKALTDQGNNLDALFKKVDLQSPVADLLPIFLSIDSDEKLHKHLLICLRRCLYDGQRITGETFEAEEAQRSYYPIAINCIKENLAPLLSGLSSGFTASLGNILS